MPEWIKLLRESLPEAIGGLTVKIVLGVLGIVSSVLALLYRFVSRQKTKNLPRESPSTPTIVNAGRDAFVGGRDVNITQHISSDDRRARAERKIDEGRKKVQEWGDEMSRSGWVRQAWHLLGHALQCTHEAVDIDPDYRRAWTLMADVYHRIGKIELAKKCMEKSYELAKLEGKDPGDFYRKVEKNIRSGYPFNSTGGLTRQSPPPWFEAKYQKYWTL